MMAAPAHHPRHHDRIAIFQRQFGGRIGGHRGLAKKGHRHPIVHALINQQGD
jgi:hypothetical protein